MIAYFFLGPGTLAAFALDEAGATLPVDLGPWTFVKPVDLAGDTPDLQEARALIERHGFCCFDQSVVSD